MRYEDLDLLSLKLTIDQNMDVIETYYQILQTEREALEMLQVME